MVSPVWIIVFILAPVLLIPAVFGLFGPDAKRSAIAIFKFVLAFYAVVAVIVLIGVGFN
jgi:hypothetical protein